MDYSHPQRSLPASEASLNQAHTQNGDHVGPATHICDICSRYTFAMFTAQTFSSGVLAIGSMAVLVSIFAADSA